METPEEMYSRLMTPPSAVGFITLDDVIKLVQHYRSQVQVLRGALRGMSNAATKIEITCERRGYSSKNALSTSEIPEHTPTLGDLRKCRKAFEATEPNKWSE